MAETPAGPAVRVTEVSPYSETAYLEQPAERFAHLDLFRRADHVVGQPVNLAPVYIALDTTETRPLPKDDTATNGRDQTAPVSAQRLAAFFVIDSDSRCKRPHGAFPGLRGAMPAAAWVNVSATSPTASANAAAQAALSIFEQIEDPNVEEVRKQLAAWQGPRAWLVEATTTQNRPSGAQWKPAMCLRTEGRKITNQTLTKAR